jgi:CubicO group peptidase (beta-lactamase class C family)
MPVRLQGVRVRGLLERAVAEGVVPGLAFGLVRRGGEAFTLHLGLAQRVPEPEALTPRHLFDLASLTKPLFTFKEVLKAVEEGLLDLDDPLSQHLPELLWLKDHPLKGVSLRALLAHTSGLPAWEALYALGGGGGRP